MGTTPLSKCRRRSQNDVPWPARNGATPDSIVGTGVTGLALAATMIAPCWSDMKAESKTKTNDYRFAREGKSSQSLPIPPQKRAEGFSAMAELRLHLRAEFS